MVYFTVTRLRRGRVKCVKPWGFNDLNNCTTSLPGGWAFTYVGMYSSDVGALERLYFCDILSHGR